MIDCSLKPTTSANIFFFFLFPPACIIHTSPILQSGPCYSSINPTTLLTFPYLLKVSILFMYGIRLFAFMLHYLLVNVVMLLLIRLIELKEMHQSCLYRIQLNM